MPEAPNVFLLSADSLRAEAFVETARTIRDATDGVRFEDAVSPACHTASSVPAFATGRFDDGTGRTADAGRPGPTPRDVPSILDSFRAAGYETVLLTDNPLVTASLDGDGEDRDGAASPRHRIEAALPRSVTRSVERAYFRVVWPRARRLGVAGPYYRPATALHEAARDRMDDTDRPTFCWIHYMDTHHPYWPPSPSDDHTDPDQDPDPPSHRTAALSRRLAATRGTPDPVAEDLTTVRELYRRACEALGTAVERFVRTLAADGLFDPATDTLVMTADHGECLSPDRGLIGHVPPASWESLVRVPLVVARPDWSVATVDDQVSLIDLPRILRDAPGVPDRVGTESTDRTDRGVGDVTAPADLAREHAVTVARTLGAGGYVRGVRRDDGRKLFGRRTAGGVDVVRTAYEVGDPADERVLEVRRPDEPADGDALAAVLARRGGPVGEVAGPEYDESRLRALGYVE